MKISISYFYNIRFFKPNMIPVSTAVWPPKWFTRQGQIYKDKNGVYNGITCVNIQPGEACDGLCPCEHHKSGQPHCNFLSTYYKQLERIDFQTFWNWCEGLGQYVQKKEQFAAEPEIVLIVFETPKNPCSERRPLVEWFAANGYDLKEWTKDAIK